MKRNLLCAASRNWENALAGWLYDVRAWEIVSTWILLVGLKAAECSCRTHHVWPIGNDNKPLHRIRRLGDNPARSDVS
jgi:hypothetical protein